jgi:hypothetical protein
MNGTRVGRPRLRFSFFRRGFSECFGGNGRALALRGRGDGRRRRRLHLGRHFRFLWSFWRQTLGETAAKLQRNLVVERTGVCLLVRDSKLRQQIQEDVRFYFELASQLIDANFTHRGRPSTNFFGQGFCH